MDPAINLIAQEKEGQVAFLLLLALIISFAFRWGLTLAKMKWKEFFATEKGKLVLQASTLLMGILIFVLSSITTGMSWIEICILALGGPMALMWNELLKIVPRIPKVFKKKAKEPKPE